MEFEIPDPVLVRLRIFDGTHGSVQTVTEQTAYKAITELSAAPWDDGRITVEVFNREKQDNA